LLFASLLLRLRRTKAKKRREEKRREEKRREEKRREEKRREEKRREELRACAFGTRDKAKRREWRSEDDFVMPLSKRCLLSLLGTIAL